MLYYVLAITRAGGYISLEIAYCLAAYVDAFDFDYDIEKTPNFYQLDENLLGNGLVWRTVDTSTTDYAQAIRKGIYFPECPTSTTTLTNIHP